MMKNMLPVADHPWKWGSLPRDHGNAIFRVVFIEEE